jgi:hypothetical protein
MKVQIETAERELIVVILGLLLYGKVQSSSD